MKNNSNLVTLSYLLFMMVLAFLSQSFFIGTDSNTSNSGSFIDYFFIKDLLFILISGIILKLVLYKNEYRNKSVLERLQKTNLEIAESNERYDIVAKATSDTIWDWKIETDNFIWNKGIEEVFGYEKDAVGTSSSWWFDRIHPEDSIKMSVKLYSFLDQKTEKWQDEYRFKCADGTYKYVYDRGFLVKDKEGKPLRMIGAIQDITKQ